MHQLHSYWLPRGNVGLLQGNCQLQKLWMVEIFSRLQKIKNDNFDFGIPRAPAQAQEQKGDLGKRL